MRWSWCPWWITASSLFAGARLAGKRSITVCGCSPRPARGLPASWCRGSMPANSRPMVFPLQITGGTRASVLERHRAVDKYIGGFIVILFGLLFAIPAHAAGYVVERGDVLDVSVVGAPGLHHKAPIDAGGQFLMPLVGDVDAAGLSLTELRAKLRELLVQKN